MIKPLASIYRDAKQKEQARSFATETLADYAADQPDELFDLLADAEEFQFPVLFDKLAVHKEQGRRSGCSRNSPKNRRPTASEDQKERLAKRQANAAVALLRLGTPERGLADPQTESRPESSQLRHSLAQSAGRRSTGDHPAARRRTRRDDSPALWCSRWANSRKRSFRRLSDNH